jgi:TRAP-type transport system periplasmic protein
MPTRRQLLTAGAFTLAAPGIARAQEVTLRAVSAFQEGTRFARPFERFMERVNQTGAGQLRINFVGGPRAMPPFEVGNAVRGGVVEIANVSGAFYTNLLPEADALKLMRRPWSELRANGTRDFWNRLHNERMGVEFLASTGSNVPFHFFLTKPIERYDLTGLRIRVTPVYRDLVDALGGTSVTTTPAEVFTALERGVVDGYGWPLQGVFDLGWERVTRFRVDPGFWGVEVNILANLPRFRALTDAQRRILNDAALHVESLDSENIAENAAERTRLDAAGIRTLAFAEADQRAFLARADEIAWGAHARRNEAFARDLRALIAR